MGPVQTQFCDNQLVRMVLPVMEEDRSVRILRAPDALYFAQHEICSFYAEQEDFERALPRCAVSTTWRARPCSLTLP